MQVKACSKCGQEKPVSEFRKQKDCAGGLRPDCKCCAADFHRKWVEKNKGSDDARKREWQKANPEKRKQTVARYFENNRTVLIERSRNNYINNKDKHNECVKRYRETHKEEMRIKSHNRRSLIRSQGTKLSRDIVKRLFVLQKGKCVCCGKPLGDDYHIDHSVCCGKPLGDDYHIDHIMPLSLGGKNEDVNVQLLRSTCNQQKFTKHPVDFMQQRGFLL